MDDSFDNRCLWLDVTIEQSLIKFLDHRHERLWPQTISNNRIEKITTTIPVYLLLLIQKMHSQAE